MSLLSLDKREEVLALVHTVEQDLERIKLWSKFLEKISDTDVSDLLDVMTSHKSLVYVFTQNLVDKTEAIKKGDRAKWQKIIDDEVEALKNTQDDLVTT